jgi:hypothetical protein
VIDKILAAGHPAAACKITRNASSTGGSIQISGVIGARMNIRRLFLIAGALVVAAAVVCVALISHWQRSRPTFKNAAGLVAAAQAFSRDQAARGQPLPASVSLDELVNGGYVPTNEVRAFDGMDVTIYPTASDADPTAILVRVRMPDGTQIAVMGDASVQQLPK